MSCLVRCAMLLLVCSNPAVADESTTAAPATTTLDSTVTDAPTITDAPTTTGEVATDPTAQGEALINSLLSTTTAPNGSAPLTFDSEKRPDWVNRLERWGRDMEKFNTASYSANGGSLIMQLLIAIVFYMTVVSKYPHVMRGNRGSAEIMSESPCFRINPGAICCTAWCMPISLLGLNLDATDTCNYWVGICAGMFCPFCTMCYIFNCSDFPEKLGAEKKGCFMSCMEIICCGCCLISQMTEALDAAAGAELGCCSVQTAGGMYME